MRLSATKALWKELKMTIKEFVKYDLSGVMFTLVDADKRGCLTAPDTATVIIADKNVLAERYGEWQVVGFEPRTKRNVLLLARKVKQ